MSNPFDDEAVANAVVDAAKKNPKKAFAVAKKVHKVNQAMNAPPKAAAPVPAPAPYIDNSLDSTQQQQRTAAQQGEKVKKVPWALYVGTWFGMPLHLHSILPLIFLLDAVSAFRFDKPFLWMLLFLFCDLILFLSILIHEYGHVIATKMCGGFATHILLWPLGGLAFIGHQGGRAAEIWIAVAGPLTHVPQIIGWVAASASKGNLDHFGAYYPFEDNGGNIDDEFGNFFIRKCFFDQVFLLAFNVLVPCYPLDGSRLLSALLGTCMPIRTVALVMCWTSIPIALALIAWGAIQNFMLMMATGVWCLYQTYILYRARQTNTLSKHFLFKWATDDLLGGQTPRVPAPSVSI